MSVASVAARRVQGAGELKPVKPREERQKVMIRARMRVGVSWNDVCILNVSPRGLGIQSADPPPRGTYVEICRGRLVIVAKVMWMSGRRAGLHSQDVIWIQALIGEPETAHPPPAAAARPMVERRRAPRAVAQAHERNRIVGRAMEAAFVAVAGLGMGAALFGMVEQALARPLTQIRQALEPDKDVTP